MFPSPFAHYSALSVPRVFQNIGLVRMGALCPPASRLVVCGRARPTRAGMVRGTCRRLQAHSDGTLVNDRRWRRIRPPDWGQMVADSRNTVQKPAARRSRRLPRCSPTKTRRRQPARWPSPAPSLRRQANRTNPKPPRDQRPNRSPFRQTSPKTTPKTCGKSENHTENRPKNR